MSTPNPLFRRAPVPAPSANPYDRYGLRQNPFPNLPGVIPGNDDPRVNGSIYEPDLRRGEQGKFDRLLVPTPAHPDSHVMAFLMDCATRFGRGVGKTAFLNHQRQRIMADLGNAATGGSEVLFAAHVQLPSDGRCRKFWQFCRLVFEQLCEQGVLAQAVWRLRAFSGVIPDAVLARLGTDLTATIGNDAWLAQQEVNVAYGLNASVTQQLESLGIGADLALRLAHDGHNPDALQSSFLRAQSETSWRQNAGTWLFDDLVRVFRAAEFTHGLLLVDDFERIVVHQSARERHGFAEEIRYYFLEGPFDNARSHFYSALWTIHPYVQELLVGPWQQVGLERFCALGAGLAGDHTIEFPPLTEAAAIPLVQVYLDRSRLPGEKAGQLRPFAADALLEAMKLVNGLPGYLLALLSRVMEHAARNEWPEVDVERVRAVYREAPVLPAEPAPARELPAARVDLQEE